MPFATQDLDCKCCGCCPPAYWSRKKGLCLRFFDCDGSFEFLEGLKSGVGRWWNYEPPAASCRWGEWRYQSLGSGPYLQLFFQCTGGSPYPAGSLNLTGVVGYASLPNSYNGYFNLDNASPWPNGQQQVAITSFTYYAYPDPRTPVQVFRVSGKGNWAGSNFSLEVTSGFCDWKPVQDALLTALYAPGQYTPFKFGFDPPPSAGHGCMGYNSTNQFTYATLQYGYLSMPYPGGGIGTGQGAGEVRMMGPVGVGGRQKLSVRLYVSGFQGFTFVDQVMDGTAEIDGTTNHLTYPAHVEFTDLTFWTDHPPTPSDYFCNSTPTKAVLYQ